MCGGFSATSAVARMQSGVTIAPAQPSPGLQPGYKGAVPLVI
jgi:hypothetical protein